VKPELDAAVAAGLAVVAVWETTATRMLAGHPAGAADAAEADGRLAALGMAGAPVYFACDFDAAPGHQAAISAYLDGAASVVGLGRTGIYSGYYPLKRAFDAGKVTYGWQTYAWSGGLWDARAQLRQTHNGVTVAGVSADWDVSEAPDFGQWPRPGPAPVPKPQPKPAPVPSGVQVTLTLPVLSEGADDAHLPHWWVRRAQLCASIFGFSLTPDGMFGPKTKSAIEAIQQGKGLPATGKLDKATWALLLSGSASA
jgi:peptidoglycan hydrolase-like protein with peptidoglycan-binding domain